MNYIVFSADGRAVVTYDEYTLIPSLDSPPTQDEDTSQAIPHPDNHNDTPSQFPSYYVEPDGWIWRARADGERHRVRWLPSMYRFTPGNFFSGLEVRGGWDISSDRIALATNSGRLVVVDASDSQ